MAEDNGEQNQGGLFDAPPNTRYTYPAPSGPPLDGLGAAPVTDLNAPKATTKEAELHALVDQHLPIGPTAWVSEEKLNSILKAVVSAL